MPGKAIIDAFVFGVPCVCKSGKGKYNVHGINTGNPVLEIFSEPGTGDFTGIIISKADQKTTQHKKDGYPNMKLI